MARPNNSKPNWWMMTVGCLILFPALKFPIDVHDLAVPYVLIIYGARLLVIMLAARLIWFGVQHQKV